MIKELEIGIIFVLKFGFIRGRKDRKSTNMYLCSN